MTNLDTLSDEALMAHREELAEAVGPLLLRLEYVDDELAKRRRRRREKILTPPWADDAEPSAAEEVPA